MDVSLPCGEVEDGQVMRGRGVGENCVVGVVDQGGLVVRCRRHGSGGGCRRVECDDNGRRGAHAIRAEGMGGETEWQLEYEGGSRSFVDFVASRCKCWPSRGVEGG